MAAADLLIEVEAAISECLRAQSFTQRQRSLAKARLAELMQARKDLISEVSESSNSGSMSSVGEIMPPS